MPRRTLRSAGVFLLLAILPASAARAHAGDQSAAVVTDPLALVTLGILGLLYAAGLRELWRRAGTGRGIPRRAALAFLAGWACLAVALVSPLDHYADGIFAAHMIQHLLLMTAAPPLLLLGRPALALTWALPRATRRLHQWTARLPRVWVVSRALLLAPLTVLLLHAAAVWAWHLPGLYQVALQHEGVHLLEHLSFLATALLLWWVILAPGAGRRWRLGTGLLLVFGTALQTGLLGALITLAPRVWYPLQAGGAAAWGLTPLEDQQLAGLIMWVPGGLLYVLAAAGLFVVWLEGPGRAVRRSVVIGSAMLAAVLGLGCSAERVPETVLPGSDPQRGREAMADVGCAGCHVIPGVTGADGNVGPPLTGIGRRTFLAGQVPNTAENMIRWIRDPQAIEPGTAMPDLGITEAAARDMAAYLYTLR